jgi:hypothetical protein
MNNALYAATGLLVGVAGFFGGKKLAERRQAKNELAVAHLREQLKEVKFTS